MSIVAEMERLETLAKRYEAGESDVQPLVSAVTLRRAIDAMKMADTHLANLINGRDAAKNARDSIIEECAAVCDILERWADDLYAKDTMALRLPSPYQHMSDAAGECAERIRYMKEEPIEGSRTPSERATQP